MSALTKTRPTDAVTTLRYTGPCTQALRARQALENLGFTEVEESIPWREAFPDLTDDALPGVALHGARTKEGLTQRELAARTGIPQSHISAMEHGTRPIGKARAKQLAAALNINYRALL